MNFSEDKVLDQLPAVQTATLAKFLGGNVIVATAILADFYLFCNVQVVLENLHCYLSKK